MAYPLTHPVPGTDVDRKVLRTSGRPWPTSNRLTRFLGTERIEVLERYVPVVARVMIAQIFILSGIMKVMDPAGTAEQMAGRGMFWIPFFLWSAAALELGGGLALLIGYKARLAALLLFLFLIPVTLTFHNWWTYEDPKEQQVNMLFFIHNVTLMGGLLLVMAFGPGPFSIDFRKRRSE